MSMQVLDHQHQAAPGGLPDDGVDTSMRGVELYRGHVRAQLEEWCGDTPGHNTGRLRWRRGELHNNRLSVNAHAPVGADRTPRGGQADRAVGSHVRRLARSPA